MKFILLLSLCSSFAEDTFRARLDLNGVWQAATTQAQVLNAPANDWKPVQLPGVLRGTSSNGSEFTWYRRSITIPREWAGMRYFLHLGGARFHPHVFLNGKLVAESLEGWTPFEVELSLVPDKEHTLAVRCQDWSATFSSLAKISEGDQSTMRAAPKGKIIAPIGGRFFDYGIWDDAWIEARPKVFLDDLSIITSVREKEIELAGKIVGGNGLGLLAEIYEEDKLVFRIENRATGTQWKMKKGYGQVRHWSPEDPHLYRLHLSLLDANGKALDFIQQKFGFRELWAAGPDFYFNGVKRHLLASSCWPSPVPRTHADIRTALLKMKEGNIIAFRLHTQPWREAWLEVADEVGMMIIEEGALWCDGAGAYAYKDERLWDNIRDHLAGMVRRDRNHPSLVMWSLENELLHCGASRHDPEAERKLGELGEFVKALDPSHLITYEADHDPAGKADVIGLHYPHELPQHYAYPNTADWLGKTVKTGTGGELLGSRNKAFTWSRRKPLYIGEYLWVPFRDFSAGSVFYGDEAYLDRGGYKKKAMAQAWRYQTIAYRRAGVSGLCPWTPVRVTGELDFDQDLLFKAQKAAYRPVAAYVREQHTRAFGGQKLTRTFDVFNDSTGKKELTLRWALHHDEPKPVINEGDEVITLGPAGYGTVKVGLSLPKVEARTRYTLRWRLYSGTNCLSSSEQAIDVFPDRAIELPTSRRVVLFDPNSNFDARVEVPRISELGQLQAMEVGRTLLIVGPNAFSSQHSDYSAIGAEHAGVGLLRQFLIKGGTALILEQQTLQGLPFGLSLTEHASTMTFPLHSGHQVMNGLKSDDFKFWSDDHYVTHREVVRPSARGAKALLVSGGTNSLAQSPLVELPFGQGRVIVCQALVSAKLKTEPAARRLLQSLLDYLAVTVSSQSKTAVFSSSENFIQQLKRLGLRMSHAAETRGAASRLVVLHGGGNVIRGAVPYITERLQKEGTHVYWHAPDKTTFKALRDELGIGQVSINGTSGPLKIEDADHEFLSCVAREDLTFVGKPQGRSWMRNYQPDPSIVDRAFSLAAPGVAKRRFEAEAMELKGHLAMVRENEAHFYTTGSAGMKVKKDEEGLYPLTVHGRGAPAADVFPMLEVKVNNRVATILNLDSKTTAEFNTLVKLPAGEASLTLHFSNDEVVNGQDRNMFLDAIELGERPVTGALETLTIPTALVVVPSGNGQIILDGIRWDKNPLNELRGHRYASTVLANLGGNFDPPQLSPAWIRPPAFEVVEDGGYFRRTKNELACATRMVLKAKFKCARGGNFRIIVKGRSTTAKGVHGAAKISIDGKEVGQVFLNSRYSSDFELPQTAIVSKGEHSVSFEFSNDLYADGEDRNLYLNALGLRRDE